MDGWGQHSREMPGIFGGHRGWAPPWSGGLGRGSLQRLIWAGAVKELMGGGADKGKVGAVVNAVETPIPSFRPLC